MLQADRGQYYGLTNYETISPIINYCAIHEGRSAINITYLEGRRFYGDLFGLLRLKNIDAVLWPVIMVINGYTSPGEYTGEPKLIGITGDVTRRAFTRSTRNIVPLG
jgi:hypothetical protein